MILDGGKRGMDEFFKFVHDNSSIYPSQLDGLAEHLFPEGWPDRSRTK